MRIYICAVPSDRLWLLFLWFLRTSGQINHFQDFRVVFDYFFPGVVKSSPISVPAEVMENWGPTYLPAVLQAIQSDPSRTKQLLNVTRAPIDPSDPKSIGETVSGLLWYNVFATNDAKQKLGGQPFDNSRRLYLGSNNDFLLNWSVFRTKADPAAFKEIAAHYQTTGKLQVPLVSLHTTGDPIVPYWHAPVYRLKAIGAGSGFLFSNIPILRYGHVNLKSGEALAGFALLVLKVSGNELLNAPQALKDPTAVSQFLTLARQAGAIR